VADAVAVAVAVAVASAVAVPVSVASEVAVDVSLAGAVSAFFSSQAARKQIAITRVATRVFIACLLAGDSYTADLPQVAKDS
jgi:hypothetical protein